MNVDPNFIITTPDSMIDDPDSREFFILRNESVVICKHRDEVPFAKQRSTYLSSGRYSPKYKKVIFWPNSFNLPRAFTLLVDGNYITPDYVKCVSGNATSVKKTKKKSKTATKDGVRKAELDNLIKNGMRLQNDSSEEDQDGASDS